MSASPRWSYVQARLQARHGERLSEADWRAIEAVRSLDQFIERASLSPLNRFADAVQASMPVHHAERTLRQAWRAYVAEVADWVGVRWRAAVLWTAYVPDPPIIDAARVGEAPRWIDDDPAFAALVETDPPRRDGVSPNAAFRVFFEASDEQTGLATRWYAHWRALWPHRDGGSRALIDLATLVKAHVERLDGAGLHETSRRYRDELAGQFARLFRRQAGLPAAVFCHLGLVALDVERLRGNLIRRRLFESASVRQVA